MEEIIKTTLIEFDKSTFLLDLIKHDKGSLYVNVRQTIHTNEKNNSQQELKINPSVLDEIIEVLKNYLHQIENSQPLVKSFLSQQKKDAISERYLKGISIEDLALQFGISSLIIQQILENRGIEIVSNELPHFKKRYFKRKPNK